LKCIQYQTTWFGIHNSIMLNNFDLK